VHEFCEPTHSSQRRLQIVRNNMRKLEQFFIRAPELPGQTLSFLLCALSFSNVPR